MTDEAAVTGGQATPAAPGVAVTQRRLPLDAEHSAHAHEVQRLFDLKARAWPAKYAPGGPLAERRDSLSRAVSRWVMPGGRVLDLGCGTGEVSRHLAATGLRVTACDISVEMLRQAAGSSGDGVVWVQLDSGWRSLPFATASFDAVIAASLLEYVADPVRVLHECGRVLRPGGVLICTVPDVRHPVRWFEGLARTAAREVLPGVAGRWPRLRQYHAYLQVSRQRHPVSRWLHMASQAGLHRIADQRAGRLAPLRLLTFSRAGNEEDRQ